jgi:hypothetical protein
VIWEIPFVLIIIPEVDLWEMTLAQIEIQILRVKCQEMITCHIVVEGQHMVMAHPICIHVLVVHGIQFIHRRAEQLEVKVVSDRLRRAVALIREDLPETPVLTEVPVLPGAFLQAVDLAVVAHEEVVAPSIMAVVHVVAAEDGKSFVSLKSA